MVKALFKAGKKPDEIIEDLYMRCLSRKPASDELTDLQKFLVDAKDPEPVLNDLFWSLLNSKEFIFNH